LGLNIDGLATTVGLNIQGLPQDGLLIGLRNPLSTDGQAILVSRINPMDVLNNGAQPNSQSLFF